MQKLRPPGAQDVARLTRHSVTETATELIRYYSQIGRFSYEPARKVARAVYAGEISLAAAIQACTSTGNPIGHKSNAEVAELIWHDARIKNYNPICHSLSKRALQIRDLSISVKPLFYYISQGHPKLYWLQPRRHFALSIHQMGLLAGIIRRTFIKDELADADLELFDVSIPNGLKERYQRKLSLSDLPHISDTEVDVILNRFADAMDIVRQSGFQPPARPERPKPLSSQITLLTD